jgi:hypothetical protein
MRQVPIITLPFLKIALDTSPESEKTNTWHFPGLFYRRESYEKQSVLFEVKEYENSNHRDTPAIS